MYLIILMYVSIFCRSEFINTLNSPQNMVNYTVTNILYAIAYQFIL